MSVRVHGKVPRITQPVVGNTILVSPFNPTGGNGVLEAVGYSTGAHYWPGSLYGTGYYPKTVVGPGDTLVVKNVPWTNLQFFGIKGTPDAPINIVTEGDAIVSFSEAMYFVDCEYINLNGIPAGTTATNAVPTLSEANQYRFRFVGSDPLTRYIGIQVTGRCSNIHIQGIKGEQLWYGIQMKTDPQCDLAYNLPGWIMSNITLKHFYFTNIFQDCCYWGNSSHMLVADDPTNGRYTDCSGTLYSDPNHLPMKLQDTEVAWGYIERTGRQGVVCGGAYYGHHYIHDIKMRYLGYELNQGQGEAVGDGGMNKHLHIYNIDADNTFLYNIADFGNQSFIHDNVLTGAGYLTQDHAIVVSQSGFLTPTTDLDALVASRPTEFTHSGTMLKNINAGGVYNISSTTKITYPTNETKSTYIFNNRIGTNSRVENHDGYIRFDNYGPAGNWNRDNVVSGNTLLDGTSPCTIERFTYDPGTGTIPWPVYSTVLGDVPTD